MNLLEAVRRFRAAGGTVTIPRRTGELVFSYPQKTTRTCRVNGRRKDVGKALERYLRRLELWPEGGRRCA